MVNDTAVVSRMGDVTRQGEEVPVRKQLLSYGEKLKVHSIVPPGLVDGGDIMFTGDKHLFVGISKRTNHAACEQMKQIFESSTSVAVHPIVIDGLSDDVLHLKSIISMLDHNVILVHDSHTGNEVIKQIQAVAPAHFTFVKVPSAVCSNVLRIHNTVVVQNNPDCADYQHSIAIIEEYCSKHGLKTVLIPHMSELIKSDGALTCGSILFRV